MSACRGACGESVSVVACTFLLFVIRCFDLVGLLRHARNNWLAPIKKSTLEKSKVLLNFVKQNLSSRAICPQSKYN